jgi:hypothetical protein
MRVSAALVRIYAMLPRISNIKLRSLSSAAQKSRLDVRGGACVAQHFAQSSGFGKTLIRVSLQATDGFLRRLRCVLIHHNLSPCPAGHRVPVQINLWATAPIVNIYFNLFLPPI